MIFNGWKAVLFPAFLLHVLCFGPDFAIRLIEQRPGHRFVCFFCLRIARNIEKMFIKSGQDQMLKAAKRHRCSNVRCFASCCLEIYKNGRFFRIDWIDGFSCARQNTSIITWGKYSCHGCKSWWAFMSIHEQMASFSLLNDEQMVPTGGASCTCQLHIRKFLQTSKILFEGA